MVRKLNEKEFKEAGQRGDISRIDFRKSILKKPIIIKVPKEEVTASKMIAALNEIKNISIGLSRDMQASSVNNMQFQAEICKSIASTHKVVPTQIQPLGAVWEFNVIRDPLGSIVSMTATRVK